MGFFILWWQGEVSNLPQGPREAPPTPSIFDVLILSFVFCFTEVLKMSLPDAADPLALALGDPLLCSFTHVVAARIEFSQ
jgi:hypothetical protein